MPGASSFFFSSRRRHTRCSRDWSSDVCSSDLLAWLQTLPEFAVEAVIAWDAGAEPERAHLAIANLTGAIRLLLGLGWPMIYFVFATAGRKRAVGAQHAAPLLPAIQLDREHAVEVVGLVPPLLYFVVILLRRSFGWVDAAVLLALYIAYLWARSEEHTSELQSRLHLVCRLLLEKKKKKKRTYDHCKIAR